MESRVIPLKLLQSAKFPFFGNLIILPCVQSSGNSCFSHISTKSGCRISAAVSGAVLETSAHNEFVPGALLFPRVAIATLISAFFGGDVSISRSLSAGWMSAGCCGSNLFSTSLTCFVHLRSCSISVVSSFPSLSTTGGVALVYVSTYLFRYFIHSGQCSYLAWKRLFQLCLQVPQNASFYHFWLIS